VNRGEQLQTAWWNAHQELREYVEPFVTIDQARHVASLAVGYWVEMAADGHQPATGPYGQLFAAAYGCIKAITAMTDEDSIEKMEDRVPADNSMLPYQLSKIYVDIWKASQLLSWDRKTIHRLGRGAAVVWPVSDGGWAELGVTPLGKLVPPLVRRAVEVLDLHQCIGCNICAQAALRWEQADSHTEAWATNRRLKREEAACQTEESSRST